MTSTRNQRAPGPFRHMAELFWRPDFVNDLTSAITMCGQVVKGSEVTCALQATDCEHCRTAFLALPAERIARDGALADHGARLRKAEADKLARINAEFSSGALLAKEKAGEPVDWNARPDPNEPVFTTAPGTGYPAPIPPGVHYSLPTFGAPGDKTTHSGPPRPVAPVFSTNPAPLAPKADPQWSSDPKPPPAPTASPVFSTAPKPSRIPADAVQIGTARTAPPNPADPMPLFSTKPK